MGIDIPNQNGSTPLNESCKYGNKAMVLLFMNRGADINTQDKDGNTILHSACSNDYGESIIEHLLQTDVLKLINNQNKEGLTPLHFACKTINVKSIELLLKKGANVEVKDQNGNTPLQCIPTDKEKETIKNEIVELFNRITADRKV